MKPDKARTIAEEERRMRAIAARFVRAEHVTEELLGDLARAILAAGIDHLGGRSEDEWIAEYFAARVRREPRLGHFGVN